MSDPASELLKSQVRDFWNQQSCGTEAAKASKFTLGYFEQVEAFRYYDQPFIHAFAQFTRYHGKKVLEVGFGAGTDFIQWLRAGARLTGVDLTPEALAHARERISVYGLPAPDALQVADAENLPFASDTFDLGYSFGVLHHSPDTEKALAELVRVTRPGGHLKVMLYNRRSVTVINRWVRFALLKGRPWRSLKWVLWNKAESPGTKGYSRGELVRLLGKLPLRNIHIHTEVTSSDYLSSSAFGPLNWAYRRLLQAAGYRYEWRAGDYTPRVNDPARSSGPSLETPVRGKPLFTGNPLGFYHCIFAEKTG
jgi:SAM-dependent methyltransferase